jgi:hypothetical protein
MGKAQATVNYEELSEAYDFVSFAAPLEHSAFIDRTTGKIYWVSDAIEEEGPEDLDDMEKYIAVPHKNDLDLGTHLVLQFAAEALPDQVRRIEGFLRHRGAYARFKDLLASEGRLEEWYAFEARCTEAALKKWCEDNNIAIVDAANRPNK